MPVNSCSIDGKSGYKWGDQGKCYTYDSNSNSSKKAAKKKALAQGLAIGEIGKSDIDDDSLEELLKSLKEWFKERWVDISRPKPGGGFEPCGREDAKSGKYPKCVPASKAATMSAEEIASAVRRKRTAESTQRRENKKPIYVSTDKGKVEKANVPTDPELYARVKAEAKAKFDVYPSAYANAWLVREYKKRGGRYKITSDDINKSEDMIDGYPAATQDISVNIRNRQECIDIANYGPMNPAFPNDDYWQAKADVFNSSVEEAKSSRCANCAAFVQTTEMIDAMAHGLGGEPMAYAIVKLANLGYCDIFEFKCAGTRTCDAWIVGGPLTDKNFNESEDSNKYEDIISLLRDISKNKEI